MRFSSCTLMSVPIQFYLTIYVLTTPTLGNYIESSDSNFNDALNKQKPQRFLKKPDMLKICHFPSENPSSYQTITIDAKEMSKYKKLGDWIDGTCEELCGPVDTFDKIESAIESAGQDSFVGNRVVTVCPGTLKVPRAMKLSLDNPVQVNCAVGRKCYVEPTTSGYPFITIENGSVLTLAGFVMRKFEVEQNNPNGLVLSGEGVLVTNQSTLNLLNCVFDSNISDYAAVISAEKSNLSITSCEFRSNAGSDIYAAITLRKSTATITRSTFYKNVFATGTIHVDLYSKASVTKSTFTRNGSLTNGGALFVSSGSSLIIGKTLFTGNSAGYGGALYAWPGSTVSIKRGCQFEENESYVDGGAIYGEVKIKRSAAQLFANNTAAGQCNNFYDSNTGACRY